MEMKLSDFKYVMPMCLLGLSCFSSCGSDDAMTPVPVVTEAKGHYFLGVRASDGTEYVMQAESLEDQDLDIKQNLFELEQSDYTWIFRKNTAVGFVYNQQFAGIGYAVRLDAADAPFTKLGEFSITTRYSNFGFFNDYLLTSVSGQVSADGSRNDGATFGFWKIGSENVSLDHTKTIWTEDLTGNGQQVTFSSIVDNGDGTFLSAMVQSGFNQTGTGNGSSVGDVKYPDSVWVAKLDADLNVQEIYRDDRISYAAGQYRSQVFSEVFRADDGTVYVFSNAFNSKTTKHAGALRINRDADGFDPDYYFDIQAAAGNYKFRRVWHVSADKFLLEIYNDFNVTSITPGHQFAIVDMGDKRFTWIQGLPAKNLITSGAETGGVPLCRDGKIYLPVTQYGKDAVIYVVNPDTGEAAEGITLKGVYEIRSIGYLE